MYKKVGRRGHGRAGCIAIGLLASGCYQGLRDGPGSDPQAVDDAADGADDDGGDAALSCAPGWVGLRRLNKREYANTLRDLLGTDPAIADALPLDPSKGGFDNNASALAITPELYEIYLDVAEDAVKAAFVVDPTRLVSCMPSSDALDDPCVLDTLLRFTERAYRRPLSENDRSELVALYAAARQDTESFADAIALVFQGVLVSPAFLYRNALPDPNGDAQPLDDYEIASRLSYFLWSTMPDDALFQRAAAGDLADVEGLREEVRRMLADPKAADFVGHFARQWLDISGLPSKSFDPVRFPMIDAGLLAAMQAETVALVQHVIVNDLPPSELLTAEYSFVDVRLAAHYGLPPIADDAIAQVTLPPEQRQGLLTHGSILAATAHPDRTSIPARGMWILDNLLCLPPPPPPPSEIDMAGFENEGDMPKTQRERLDQHRQDPSCAGCHVLMDELGFGLEHYDAVGRYRELDEGLPVDASGRLPDGRTFESPMELADLLADDDVFARCVAANLLSYALGRLLETDDACVLDEVLADVGAGDASVVDLIAALVTSDAFRFEARAPQEESP